MSKKTKKLKGKGNLLLYLLYLPTFIFPPTLILFIIIANSIKKVSKTAQKQILLSQTISLIPYISLLIMKISPNYYEIIISPILITIIVLISIFENKRINSKNINNKLVKICQKIKTISFIITLTSVSAILTSYIISFLKNSLGISSTGLYIYFTLLIFILTLSVLISIISSLLIKIEYEKEKLYEK